MLRGASILPKHFKLRRLQQESNNINKHKGRKKCCNFDTASMVIMPANDKLSINNSKTLKLVNVAIRELVQGDFENYFIVVEQIDNYIKSKGSLPVGPLVQLAAFEFNKFGEAEIKIHLMRQANNFIHKVEPPYAMEPVIRVPDCLYVRYTGPEEKLKFAYDKLNLIAFELDIPLVGECYTIFVDKHADTLVADVFMEKEKDE